MVEKNRGPIVFAHRGASAFAPENTLSAFLLAVEYGADGIELDAKLSADGEVMVIHDPTVDRTTNGSGRVNQISRDDLQRLDAGSSLDPRFAREKIPTLEEVFITVGHKTLINVELTNYTSSGDSLVERVAALVKKQHLQDGVIFSSFNPFNLVKMNTLLDGACATGILAMPGARGWVLRGALGRWAAPGMVHPFMDDVTQKFVQSQHRIHRKVNVWTVNKAVDLRRLMDYGVDGIITDDPKLAITLREGA